MVGRIDCYFGGKVQACRKPKVWEAKCSFPWLHTSYLGLPRDRHDDGRVPPSPLTEPVPSASLSPHPHTYAVLARPPLPISDFPQEVNQVTSAPASAGQRESDGWMGPRIYRAVSDGRTRQVTLSIPRAMSAIKSTKCVPRAMLRRYG